MRGRRLGGGVNLKFRPFRFDGRVRLTEKGTCLPGSVDLMADQAEKLYLGIDIGSTTYKAVVLSQSGTVLATTYQRT